MIKINNERSTYQYQTSENELFLDVKGTDKNWDFYYQKFNKIERIKFLTMINEGLSLKDAKDIIENHIQYVPLPVYNIETLSPDKGIPPAVIIKYGKNNSINEIIGPFDTYTQACDYAFNNYKNDISWSWAALHVPESK